MKKIIVTYFLLVLVALVLVDGGKLVKKPVPVKEMANLTTQVVEYEDVFDNNEVADNGGNGDNSADKDAQKDNKTFVCVIGNASLEISPDSAKVCVKIEKLNEDMAEAKNQCFQTFDKALEDLKKLDISQDDVCLDYFNCYPDFKYDNGRQLIGYMSNLSFCVNVDSIDKIDNVVDSLTESGVTCICDIEYKASELDNAYNEALSKALDNAKEKAGKLLNKQDLSIRRIKEERVYSSNQIYRCYAEQYSSSPLMGKIEIRAMIIVEMY